MKAQSNFLDSILPKFGNTRKAAPVYCANQKMFISDNYISAAGNTYYKGVRFSDRTIVVEHIGLFHNWTYIDEIKLYAFDGTQPTLISSVKFDKCFYSKDLIRDEAEKMMFNYISSQSQMKGANNNQEYMRRMATDMIGETYNNQIEKIAELKAGISKLLDAK